MDIEIRRGEIHALLGNNGSGKSTLIKVLAGVVPADRGGGTIRAGDRTIPADSLTPKLARKLGLTFVHQVPPIFPTMSVAENMAIGRGYPMKRGFRVNWRDQDLRTIRLQEKFRISGDPDTSIEYLRPADRTLAAIARALQDQEEAGQGVLILDEPTATLPAPDVELLLTVLKRYAARGQAVLFISHRLDEVTRFCDRVTAIREGKNAGTHDVKDMNEQQLINLMLGRSLERLYPERINHVREETALELRAVTAWPVQDVSFSLKKGEVLGVAGLIGSGKSELLRALFGAWEIVGGSVRVEGKPVRLDTPIDAIRAGLAYVPPDRGLEASFPTMTLRENLTITHLGRYFRGFRLRHSEESKDARQTIQDYLIAASRGKAADETEFRTLSGGNQQKAILARWLRLKPKVLMLEEPTQGVAIDARAEIYRLIREAAEQGTSVLVVSSDFEELARVSDRVLVMNQGQIMSELVPPELSGERLTQLAHFYVEGKQK